MKTVASHDGTSIAFERGGEGLPIIFVFGAFNDHNRAVPLASALQQRFTTYVYDRRGRGSSGDNQPYAVQREIEDVDALITGDSSLPEELIGSVVTPTLVVAGDASPPFLQNAARAVADALPNGKHRPLPGRTHDIVPEVTAPIIEAFGTGSALSA